MVLLCVISSWFLQIVFVCVATVGKFLYTQKYLVQWILHQYTIYYGTSLTRAMTYTFYHQKFDYGVNEVLRWFGINLMVSL